MLQNFHVAKFRVKNISHKWTVCENISLNKLYTYSEIVKHGGVSACIRGYHGYRRQLLAKSWRVRENHITLTNATHVFFSDRKHFVVLKIRCRKYFARLIFIHY